MMRSYEFKQEYNHTMHETRSWGTYPSISHEQFYYPPPSPPSPPPPPPSIQKMLNYPTKPPSYHYDPSYDEDNHHLEVVVHDGRQIHHDDHGGYAAHHAYDKKNNSQFHYADHGGYAAYHAYDKKNNSQIHHDDHGGYAAHHAYDKKNNGQIHHDDHGGYGAHHAYDKKNNSQIHHDDHGGYAAHHAYEKKNQPQGKILRPPLGYVNRHQTHHQGPITDHFRHENSRFTNNNNNNNKKIMEDSSKKKYGHYYDDGYSRFKDGDDYVESLIKGMQELGGGMVKKLEVIEYERTTYRGGHQSWNIFSNGYPKSSAPRVMGF